MAYEDFTAWSETDPNSAITVAENKVTCTALNRQSTSYVYKDYGSEHFGDFEHLFSFQRSNRTADSWNLVWGISDAVGDRTQQASDDFAYLISYGDGKLYMQDAAGNLNDSYSISDSTSYYVTVSRATAAFSAKIYSDSDRTNLLDTLTGSGSSSALQYLYAACSLGASPSRTQSSYTENFDIGDDAESEEITKSHFDRFHLNYDRPYHYFFDRWHLHGRQFWSKLGSDGEITSPETGPSGTIYEPWAGEYDTGKFGNAQALPAGASCSGSSGPPRWNHFDEATPGEAGTVEFWAYVPGKPSENTCFFAMAGQNAYNGSGRIYRLRAVVEPLGDLKFEAQYTSTASGTTNYALADTSIDGLTGWHHFAFVWDCGGIGGGADTARIYIDGVEQDAGSTAFDWTERPEGSLNNNSYLILWANAYENASGVWSDLLEGDNWLGDWPDALIDNLVAWNFARESFLDRFDEDPDPLSGGALYVFDRWHIGGQPEKVQFDRWNLFNAAAKSVFDRWNLEKDVSKIAFDAWSIADELSKVQFDQYHIFTTAAEKIKKAYDRFHIYGAARKTVVDLYNILGPIVKAAFDRWHLYSGQALAKKAFDLYRIYQQAGYLIYSNSGDGGPVHYNASIGFTTGTTWSTGSLSTATVHRFGVRARNALYEEQNTSVVVSFELDADGNEVEGHPNAPTEVEAEAAEGGRILLRWRYDSRGEGGTCTAFKVYQGADTSGLTLEESVTKTSGSVTFYEWTSAVLTEGSRYHFRVRAATAGGTEDEGTLIVSAVPDATAPGGFSSVSSEIV